MTYVGFAGAGVLVYVEAPKLVVAGSRVTLLCQYDLQGEELHSVKWYREHTEFYRYIPEHNPPALAFPASGIAVDVSEVLIMGRGRGMSDPGLYQ